jgi:hypothetical protein
MTDYGRRDEGLEGKRPRQAACPEGEMRCRGRSVRPIAVASQASKTDGVACYVSQRRPQGCQLITNGFGRIEWNLRAVV